MSYLDTYTEMMQLRGLQPHTLKNYKTYIIAYLDYAENILHKEPEAITWSEMRVFIRWLQDSRQLADRTVNMAISQLRFFTIFVLHKPWDETQLPHRKFDTFLPFVPSQDEVKSFLNSIENLRWLISCTQPDYVSVKSAISDMKTSAGKICPFTSGTERTVLTVMPSSPNLPWMP